MTSPSRSSAVLTVRISRDLKRSIGREAQRRRRTRSAVLREILEDALKARGPIVDLAQEARRQSLLVSGRASEREALRFAERIADHQGGR
jgi:predicted transcriptional regulator